MKLPSQMSGSASSAPKGTQEAQVSSRLTQFPERSSAKKKKRSRRNQAADIRETGPPTGHPCLKIKGISQMPSNPPS